MQASKLTSVHSLHIYDIIWEDPCMWCAYCSWNTIIFTCTDTTVYYNAYFGESSGPYHLDDLHCNGYETNLLSCSRGYNSGGVYNNGIDVHNCAPGNEAGVTCDGRWTSTIGCIHWISHFGLLVSSCNLIPRLSSRHHRGEGRAWERG